MQYYYCTATARKQAPPQVKPLQHFFFLFRGCGVVSDIGLTEVTGDAQVEERPRSHAICAVIEANNCLLRIFSEYESSVSVGVRVESVPR